MSDQTLYRTNEPHAEEIHDLIEIGMLVPVEPCRHGNYARHVVGVLDNWKRVYCDGKPEDDDE